MADQASMEGKGLPSLIDSFNRLDPRQRIAGMVGVALMIALVVGGYLWTREPSYAVLFSNLSERDGGQIVTALTQQNVPYRFNDSGSALLVPGNMVHDVRLKLASQGLPKGGLVGFELMENQKLGISQFAEQINYQRGLEGELSRSIMSLGAVAGARVHLAIPKQTAFLRDEQKPSASVLLALHPGRTLDNKQVAGIVHLVSSSVPLLNPANVSVIDQDGNLVSQQKNPLAEAGMDPSQLRYVREIEANYIKRIESIVGTVVGNKNVRAQVTADIDFSQIDQVAETYKPNPRNDAAVRSQQISESGNIDPNASGVPGALTNQPPVPATAPVTTPPVAGAATGDNGEAAKPYSRNSTTNFEVDKTIRHTRGVPGSIRRLSVAVVVNHKKDEAKGKTVPLSEAEIKQVTELVREAMGFSQERGDTLNVANANFTASPNDEIAGPPLWKDPENVSMAKDLFKYAVIAFIAFMLWNRLIKPMLDRLAAVNRAQAEATARARQAAGESTEAYEGGYTQSNTFDIKLAEAKEIAKQDPKLVANVIKEWVSGGEPR